MPVSALAEVNVTMQHAVKVSITLYQMRHGVVRAGVEGWVVLNGEKRHGDRREPNVGRYIYLSIDVQAAFGRYLTRLHRLPFRSHRSNPLYHFVGLNRINGESIII